MRESHSEVVSLSRIELGRCLKMGFEEVWGKVTESGMSPFGVVVGDAVADFQPGVRQRKRPPSNNSALKRLQNDSAWALS